MNNKIMVLKGDITKISADIIVNAANTSLLGGGGVDGAIHRAGGKAILEECKKIRDKQGRCKTGEAVITTAGNLSAKYVVHTVGPVWNGGGSGEENHLKNCYRNSLELAVKNHASSIAFPNISTGIYKFPKDKACYIALDSVSTFLEDNDTIHQVLFVCYDEENYRLYLETLQELT
jgi:O-acetyl-ADP-ribose deacetylase